MSKQDDNGDNAISVEYLMGVWEDNDENKSEETKKHKKRKNSEVDKEKSEELHETQTKQTKLLTDDEDTNDKKENEIPLEVLSRFAQKLLENLENETRDTLEYRKPPEERFENDLDLDLNVKFFSNQMAAVPNKETIKEILAKWKDNYDLLEQNHSYIQWLFPIYSQGMNYQSHPLQLHEYRTLKSNPETKRILLKSFDMMLRFYGSKRDEDGDLVRRRKQYNSRYANLIRRSHNYLRISRILKCLGDFDMEAYQLSWLRFLLDEIFVEKKLIELADSFTRYWIHTVKDDVKRDSLKQEVKNLIINSDL